MTKENLQFWMEKPPSYPLDLYVVFFAVPVGLIIYYSKSILSLFSILPTPVNRAVLLALLFVLSICAQIPNVGIDVAYLFWGFTYASILGIIEGLTEHNFDMGFVENKIISIEARIGKLNSMKDKWFKGLNIFTGILIAAAISGGIHFLTFNPSFMGKQGSTYANSGMVFEILFIAPGIILGIFWSIFQKINLIEAQFDKIKSASED